MAELSAAQVMALRKKTGLPMMECKQALTECNGDETAAVEWLSKKHKGKMESRSDRETGEGRIGIYIDQSGTTGGIVELRCETAPVGKNEVFIELANDLARHVAEGSESAPDGASVKEAMDKRMTEVYGKLQEAMNIGTCRKLSGDALTYYVHHDGKSGVLIALNGKPADAEVGKNLAMHVTFHKPLAIDRDGVPADQIEKVRKDAIDMAKEEGKPEQVIDKIAEGRVSAFVSENALMEQEHARTDLYGRKKVKDVLAEHGVTGISEMAYVAISA